MPDLFAAESAAWHIKALGQEISADAHALALTVKRDAVLADLRRRVATLRKMAVAVEQAAGQFETALQSMEETAQ